MPPRAFAAVASGEYFPGLEALLRSLRAYHGGEIPVFVFDAGLSAPQRESLRADGVELRASDAAGAWEAKQKALAALLPSVRTVFLLDADLVLTSRMDDVFEKAEEGWIVSSRDGDDSGDIVFGADYARYSEALVGLRMPNFNSGALCLDTARHWDLALLWGAASGFGQYSPGDGAPLGLPGHGDQGLLVALAALLGKRERLQLLPMSEWCDCWGEDPYRIVARDGGRLSVVNARTGRPQRLVHSSGPKWWTPEGEAHLARFGDKLDCFRHFSGLAARAP